MAFTFGLDSFQITDTRSLHEDTDYLSFTLVVNPQGAPGTPQTKVKSMGSINNGVHQVNLAFENITVNATDTVVLNYLIYNSGLQSVGGLDARVAVETSMEVVGATLATLVAVPRPPGGDVKIPQLASALGLLQG